MLERRVEIFVVPLPAVTVVATSVVVMSVRDTGWVGRGFFQENHRLELFKKR